MHGEMLEFFDVELRESPELFKSATTVEKGHGRVERRTCFQTGELGWFEDLGKWRGMKSVAMVESERSVRDIGSGVWRTSSERRLFISSKEVDAGLALRAIRSH